MAVKLAGGDVGAKVNKKNLEFLDLPTETHNEIVSHCSQTDLICLALVSKRCRELAAAQLYRNFHIIFPDDDDISFDSPIDGLAGGLDTFTTSDYDYAQHLKDLSMDTLSAGAKGELSYQSYLYSASCGKFLNTLLCLTLKKARSLESFRWNIRVELSRPVYQMLHRLSSLKNLHVRMQAGESYYVTPPPLPVSLPVPSGSLLHTASQTPVAPNVAPPPLFSSPSHALLPASKPLPRSRPSKEDPVNRDPPTLSGFLKLKRLCILDIDDVGIIDELTACVESSSSTLTELQLSLSNRFASQARKPLPDSDPDDSDVDDEFQIEIIPVPHTSSNDTSGPVRAFRAHEERKVQEAMLGKVLGVKNLAHKNPQSPGSKTQDQPDTGGEVDNPSNRDPRKVFISSIRAVSAQILSLLNGTRDLSASQQEILDTIEKAARKYIESGDTLDRQRNDEAGASEGSAVQDLDSFLPAAQEPVAASNQDTPEQNAGQSSIQYSHGSGDASRADALSPLRLSKGERVAGEHDENGVDELIDSTFEASRGRNGTVENGTGQSPDERPSRPLESSLFGASTTSGSASNQVLSDLAVRKMRFESMLANYNKLQDLVNQLRTKVDQLRHGENSSNHEEVARAHAELHRVTTNVADLEGRMGAVRIEIEAIEKQVTPKSPEAGAELVQRCMNEYVRHTRGLSLETLRIYLIPARASVLSRAVNLHCLKQLTLLNVGNQTPIWNLLLRENKVSPLSLRSVFTDNVSSAFLNCMSQLEELHELFMLERNQKYKPESFGPRTTTTMHQIRVLVLSKHLPTLKRLMIRDDSGNSNWDANMKTVTQICRRGTRLEELGLSMDIHAVHTFAQFVHGLVSLRAIHIIHFRNNDTCIWVMRESLRFIADSLSHRPELKVEWIAMADDGVHRIVRNSEDGKVVSQERSNRGNGRARAASFPASVSAAYPILPSIPTESDSDSDDEGFNDESLLRYRTYGPIQFYDVWGVKIFKKEIRTGCL